MATSQAKENILKKIRQALSHPVPLPFPHSEGSLSVYTPAGDDHAVTFAQEFTKLQGKFAFCEDEKDLAAQLRHLFSEKGWKKIYCRGDHGPLLTTIIPVLHEDLESCDASVTGCEYLVARTGSLVLSTNASSGRTTSVYAPIHICIATTDQLVFEVKDALVLLKEKYGAKIPSFITFASGPSRTADIEKTLVTGVHGPKEVYCFLVDV